MDSKLKEKLLSLPTTSGVYLMKDKNQNIIYVGKAKNLKRRVNSYFIHTNKNLKTEKLVSNIENFDYILTASELDAFVLENNLIKKYQPHYNILLKDSKTFPYIKINTKKIFPKIETTRIVKKDGSKYFGPYFAGASIKEVVELINSAFKVRTCNLKLSETKPQKRECLKYSMGLCSAPCTLKVTNKEYMEEIKRVTNFLNGNVEEIEEILKQKMNTASENLQFERAIELREQLKILERLKHKYTTQFPNMEDSDVIGYYSNGINATVCVLLIRNGKMFGSNSYNLTNLAEDKELVSSFIQQYYGETSFVPKQILVGCEVVDRAVVEEYLEKVSSHKVEIQEVQKGTKRKLVDIATSNAKEYLEKSLGQILVKENRTIGACNRLKDILQLKDVPYRMECYDISNISGTFKVASMVVFINGEPAKKHYRKFIIKTVEGSNDFASLQEALTRRIKELSGEDVSFSYKPNLIVIDGGKGQLSSVKEIFDKYNVTDIELISLAKREEEVFTTRNNIPVVMKKSDIALQLLQRIRDEAHRFAITFHRSLRGKNMIKSELENITGVGKVKMKNILKSFENLDDLRTAGIDRLMQIEGINESLAKNIYQYFHKDETTTC